MADVVTTYLELTDPAAIRPARGSAEVVRVDPPDGAVNRRFYEEVGAGYSGPTTAGATTPGGRRTRSASRRG